MVKKILSIDAYKLLCEFKDSILIDVRMEEEWNNVGIPDLHNIVFNSYKAGKDLDFVEIINEMFRNKDWKIFFICRSGVRSMYSAKLIGNNGYKNCYNIEDGFEGSIAGLGWIKNNLPIRFNKF